MLNNKYDLIIIGGGPAGLAAAIGAREAGINRVLVVERLPKLGGVLYQCIHMGFGLQYFGEELSGPEFADRLIERVHALDIEIMTNSSALKIERDNKIIIASAEKGIVFLETKALIVASGCRERPLWSLPVAGTRPSGVYTAGAAQRMINLRGYDIGDNVIILGSGDIGLIMARRLKLLGKNVIAVIEQQPYCTGLLRNKIQCIDDFNIPLQTGHTITEISGDERITGVTVCPVDNDLSPILEKNMYIECDTLITSIGLIPEIELLDTITKDGNLQVNENMQTQLPWIFICGNSLYVHDLVDDVVCEANKTGKFAANYIKGLLPQKPVKASLTSTYMQKKLAANEIVCILCPKSCVLQLKGDSVTGAGCSRGEEFVYSEISCPKRYITYTIGMEGNPHLRLPVRSTRPVAINKIYGIIREINKNTAPPETVSGQVIIENVGETGADIMSTTSSKNLIKI